MSCSYTNPCKNGKYCSGTGECINTPMLWTDKLYQSLNAGPKHPPRGGGYGFGMGMGDRRYGYRFTEDDFNKMDSDTRAITYNEQQEFIRKLETILNKANDDFSILEGVLESKGELK